MSFDEDQTGSCDNSCGLKPSEDNAELGDQITLLAAQINAATYQFLKFIAEFDRRSGWSGAGIRSCSHWLNWKCGIAHSAARERVRVARCLDQLPLINEAFEKGQISYSKVRALTRVATNANEDYYLMISDYGTASHMEQLVRKYQQVERNQQPKQTDDQYQQRKLTCYQDDDGMWIIHAKLPQVEGGLMVKAIEEIVRQQNKPLPDVVGYAEPEIAEPEPSVSAETPSAEPGAPDPKVAKSKTVAPEPSVSAETPSTESTDPEKETLEQAVCAETFSTELGTNESGIVETATFAQRRADALSAVFEHYIASDANENDEGLKSLAGHERCQVVLHLDVETLKQDHHCCEHGHDDADNPTYQHQMPPHLDKQWISLENAKRFSCDASLLTVLEDKDGNVLNLGRKTRTIPPMLSRALNIRDETCRFPGCCESRYVEFHHITHWANGGETNKDNLVKLCCFHHDELHLGHYSIEIKTSGEKRTLVFKTSTGQVMEPNPKFSHCTVESTVKGYFEQQWPDINSHTGDSRWQGETMDYGMAIDALLARQEKSVADACA